MKSIHLVTLATIAFAPINHAAVVSLDFESGTTGWTFETEAGATGTPSYSTAAGTGSTPATGGLVISSHNGTISVPGGYLLNSGGIALDATQPITGSFDYAFDRMTGAANDNYIGGTFLMGNITSASGLTGTAGQFVGAAMGRNTFGNRTYIINGTGDRTGATGSIDIRTTNVWRTVSFSWTPSSGTTGTFQWTINNQHNAGTNSISRVTTLDSDAVYFAFGSAASSGTISSESFFDNINITGTALVVPEPSAALLGSLGALALLRRRR